LFFFLPGFLILLVLLLFGVDLDFFVLPPENQDRILVEE